MTSAERPILQCVDLSKRYEETQQSIDVFNQVHFSVMPAEFIGILGVSGAGKSTFLHLLAGLDTPSSGDVLLRGNNLTKMSEVDKSRMRNQHLGFIYQFHHLLPEFNALENVCMPLWIQGVSSKVAKKQAAELIDRVGLSQRATHRIAELSGGERQRIAIARALVTKPSCVLADEPTGNLDAQTAEQVFGLMTELNKTLKTSFVIVTHNKALTKQMDRSFMLTHGKLTSLNQIESA